MKKLYSLAILLLLSLLIASCSKKDDKVVDPGPDGNSKPPSFPTAVTFKGPNTQSNDQYALITKSSVESLNAYPLLISGMFSAVQPNSSNGGWQWVLRPGGTATETFTAKKNSDGSFSWTLVLNGTIDNDTYNNFKLLEGTTSEDGKTGSWKIYDDNTTILVAEYSWSTSSAGVLSGVFLEYDNGAVSGKIEVVNNTDNSGSLKVYDHAALSFYSTWKADGTGTWHSYENGVEKTNGNWQ